MNKVRILYSLVISAIILVYPIIFIIDNISIITNDDDRIKLGFAIENNTIYNLKRVEKKLDRKVDIFHIFQKITEEPKIDTMQDALDKGYIVLLTLEPWGGRINDSYIYTPPAIVNGSIGPRIDKWTIALNSLKFKKGKFIVRIMHEINGNWYPWSAYTRGSSPEYSRGAYIYLVEKLKNSNNETMFMYGVHYRSVRYDDVTGVQYAYNISDMLPEDRYYDIIGISGYNRFSGSGLYKWRSFSELYHPMYINLTNITDKPIWIAEISTVSKGGNKAEWIKDVFQQIRYNYTRIDAIIWFDENKWFEGDIVDWAFDSTKDSEIIFKESVKFKNMKRDINKEVK